MNRIPPEFIVHIPEDRTAQFPKQERDSSRILVYDKTAGNVVHVGRFRDIVSYVAGDIIVVNDTKVVPARVFGSRPGGGKVELLFLPASTDDHITVLINPSRRLRLGMTISLPNSARFVLSDRNVDGGWSGTWSCDKTDETIESYLKLIGQTPLPPYIRREAQESDRTRYQTVYAENAGSVAAPTAGLHFTPKLLKELESQGSKIAKITLDVGLGTFIPIRSDDLSEHDMHSESYHISAEAAEMINVAREVGRNITTVGTTSVRALESSSDDDSQIKPGARPTNLFIHPPDYRFKVVDRLLTNFHRPDSTLLQLIAALIGWDGVNECYRTALESDFRFYSYGDAMLIV